MKYLNTEPSVTGIATIIKIFKVYAARAKYIKPSSKNLYKTMILQHFDVLELIQLIRSQLAV